MQTTTTPTAFQPPPAELEPATPPHGSLPALTMEKVVWWDRVTAAKTDGLEHFPVEATVFLHSNAVGAENDLIQFNGFLANVNASVTAPLEEAAEQFKSGPGMEKLKRLRENLATAQGLLIGAEKSAQEAKTKVNDCLAAGEDPLECEDAFRQALANSEVYKNRVNTLGGLLQDEQAVARKKLCDHLEKLRKELLSRAEIESEKHKADVGRWLQSKLTELSISWNKVAGLTVVDLATLCDLD